jgi:hypothetical protein
MATAHNAINALEAARDDVGGWSRAWRKVSELRAALETMQEFSKKHFEAMDGWRRP